MKLEAEFTVQRREFGVTANLSMGPGERLALFGPSGAGKTTILEAIAGTIDLTAGQVSVADVVVNQSEGVRRTGHRRPVAAPRGAGISFVRQPTSLWPHLTVLDNVAYGCTSPELGLECLESVGLADLASSSVVALSGGQRQRVALARALARPFNALLLDEPLSGVDGRSKLASWDLVHARVKDCRAVSILVTHDLPEAQAFGQQLAIVDNGNILAIGDPERVVRNPRTARTAELVGYGAFVRHDETSAWAVHPDRCLPGAIPGDGLVLSGIVIALWPSGARFAFDLLTVRGSIRVHSDEAVIVGAELTVTVINPPLVGMVTSGG